MFLRHSVLKFIKGKFGTGTMYTVQYILYALQAYLQFSSKTKF